MQSSFLNLDNEQRAFIATNFYNLDEGLRDYLSLKGLVSSHKNSDSFSVIHPREVLETTV